MSRQKLIDLTHPIVHQMAVFPGDPSPVVEPLDTLTSAGYNTTRLSLSTHTGTHLDAPYHFFNEGRPLDEVELERFYGPASVIDLGPGPSITVETLEPHSSAFGPGARVLYRTGWGGCWGSEGFYRGYPSLTVEAARWIADRGIALLGMDTPSPSEDYRETHLVLLGAGIILVESLANLEQLPSQFTLCCFPLSLSGHDGSPVRAVALAD